MNRVPWARPHYPSCSPSVNDLRYEKFTNLSPSLCRSHAMPLSYHVPQDLQHHVMLLGLHRLGRGPAAKVNPWRVQLGVLVFDREEPRKAEPDCLVGN